MHGEYGDFLTKDGVMNYYPGAGRTINQCVKECVAKSKETNQSFYIKDFNGVSVFITPNITESEAIDSWQETFDKNAEMYRNSPEGKEAERKRKERAANDQMQVDVMLRVIPKNMDSLLSWLVRFSQHADNVSVQYDTKLLADKLESFGYRHGAHVDKKGEWTKQEMGEYVIGQAIDCLRRGMPPHPITEKFVKEYQEMEKTNV